MLCDPVGLRAGWERSSSLAASAALTLAFVRGKENLASDFASYKENILIQARESSEVKGRKSEHWSCLWLPKQPSLKYGAVVGEAARSLCQCPQTRGNVAPMGFPIIFAVSGAAASAVGCH